MIFARVEASCCDRVAVLQRVDGYPVQSETGPMRTFHMHHTKTSAKHSPSILQLVRHLLMRNVPNSH